MRTTRRWARCGAVAAGLALTGLTGCQTWFGGMTLPSGRYLEHPPQYFAPDPSFPLPRELASQEDPGGAAARAGAPGLAPAPLAPAAPVPLGPLPGMGGGAPGGAGVAPVNPGAVPPN